MYIQILAPTHKRIRRRENIALVSALLICKEVMTLWDTLSSDQYADKMLLVYMFQ